jgi:hypothetical protein
VTGLVRNRGIFDVAQFARRQRAERLLQDDAEPQVARMVSSGRL